MPSDDRFRENIQAVHDVLEEIDAHESANPCSVNKIDCMEDQKPRIDRDEEGAPRAVWVFCDGRRRYWTAVWSFNWAFSESQMVQYRLCIHKHQGRIRSLFFSWKCIQQEEYDENSNLLR